MNNETVQIFTLILTLANTCLLLFVFGLLVDVMDQVRRKY